MRWRVSEGSKKAQRSWRWAQRRWGHPIILRILFIHSSLVLGPSSAEGLSNLLNLWKIQRIVKLIPLPKLPQISPKSTKSEKSTQGLLMKMISNPLIIDNHTTVECFWSLTLGTTKAWEPTKFHSIWLTGTKNSILEAKKLVFLLKKESNRPSYLK